MWPRPHKHFVSLLSHPSLLSSHSWGCMGGMKNMSGLPIIFQVILVRNND